MLHILCCTYVASFWPVSSLQCLHVTFWFWLTWFRILTEAVPKKSFARYDVLCTVEKQNQMACRETFRKVSAYLILQTCSYLDTKVLLFSLDTEIACIQFFVFFYFGQICSNALVVLSFLAAILTPWTTLCHSFCNFFEVWPWLSNPTVEE